MIFDAGSLFRIVTALAEEEGVPVPVSIGILGAIVREAERLAAGRAEDEPAALFYASARRAHLFAKTARPFLDGIGRAQAVRVGLVLDADELDIILLRGRIGHGTANWMDVGRRSQGGFAPPTSPPGEDRRSGRDRLATRKKPWPRHCTMFSNGIDYLLTWNCTHIANAAMRHKIDATCREAGYAPVVLCTPEELMEE